MVGLLRPARPMPCQLLAEPGCSIILMSAARCCRLLGDRPEGRFGSGSEPQDRFVSTQSRHPYPRLCTRRIIVDVTTQKRGSHPVTTVTDKAVGKRMTK